MTKYAKTYAGALYDLAAEEGREDEILNDIALACDVLRKEPEYRRLLSSPAISKEERKSLLRESLGSSMGQYTMNFLCMLIDGGSLSELENCEREYVNRYNIAKNILEVSVTSAVALSEKQRDSLVSAIEKKTGKKVRLTEKLDPSVIGGLRLSADGKLYDGTIEHHLKNISQMLQSN